MIRVERTAELALVRRLDCAIFPHDDPPNVDGSRWWLAWDGDEAVAFGGARPLSREPALLLERCGVLESHRGQGIQLRLLRARVRWAYELRVDSVITYTHPQNPASANSLIHAGFRLYLPANPWAGEGFLYWRRDL